MASSTDYKLKDILRAKITTIPATANTGIKKISINPQTE